MSDKEGLQEIARLAQLDIEQARKRQDEKNLQLRIKESAQASFIRADKLLDEFGEAKTASMGTGVGGGAIGYRLEPVAYLQTPKVPIEIDSISGRIYLKQKISSRSNYQFGLDSLDIVLTYPSSRSVTLFEIGEEKVESVEGELGEEGFAGLNQVLDFLEEKLKEQPKRTKDKRGPKSLHDLSLSGLRRVKRVRR